MRSRSGSKIRRNVAAFHLCGIASAAGYGWLCLASRESQGAGLADLFGTLALAWLLLAVAHRVISRGLISSRALLFGVVGWGILFRLIGMLASPVLEDDFHRYLWDGRNFAVHGSPYDRPPLDDFGDEEIPVEFQAVLDGINNPDLPTIYGPVWQYAFLFSYRLAPASLLPLKLLLLAAELATLFLLFGRRRPVAALLYFWCPLLVHESAWNAHPESLGIFFVAAALWSLQRQRGGWVGLTTALALGSRVFAGVLLPFLLLCQRRLSWPIFAGTLAALYAPFLWQGGGLQTVSLQAFAGGWEFNSSGYALTSLAFGPAVARWISVLVFGAFMAVVFLRHLKSGAAGPLPRFDRIFGLFFLLSPVVNPWYLLWLLPFACRHPSRWAFTALAAVSLSYAHGMALPELGLDGYAHPWWLRPIEFGAILIAVVIDWRSPLQAGSDLRTSTTP